MSVNIRPSIHSDAMLAAQVFYMSMGKLADYLFGAGRDVIESTFAELFKRNAGRFGFELATVAEVNGEALGMLVANSGAELNSLNVRTFLPLFYVMGFKQAAQFIIRGIKLPGGVEAEPDEYFISNLGVLPDAQGQGIGSALLDHAEQTARACGLYKCSLIVGSHNENALRLYQHREYEIVETVHDKNEALSYHRMVKQLN